MQRDIWKYQNQRHVDSCPFSGRFLRSSSEVFFALQGCQITTLDNTSLEYLTLYLIALDQGENMYVFGGAVATSEEGRHLRLHLWIEWSRDVYRWQYMCLWIFGCEHESFINLSSFFAMVSGPEFCMLHWYFSESDQLQLLTPERVAAYTVRAALLLLPFYRFCDRSVVLSPGEQRKTSWLRAAATHV
jgi:hypothetical protein